MGYSNLLAEDKRLVTYRPRLNKITGSVTATVLLQQIIFHSDNVGNRPFYKFRAPCEHKLYREGDSWTEELGFSPAEFDTARSKIATRVKKGDSKAEALKGETASHLVIYWTDASRVTWYLLNVDLLNRILEKLYADSRNSNYQESEESPNSESQDSESTRKLEKQDLPLSEIPSEISTENTEKTDSTFPEKQEQTDGRHNVTTDTSGDGAAVRRLDTDNRGGHSGKAKADPLMQDLERRTLAAHAASGGDHAIPAHAGGADAAANAALVAMYEALGSEPPREGTNARKAEAEILSQVLRDRAVKSPNIAKKAGQEFGLANQETPQFANPFLSSFPAAFGNYVGKAKKAASDAEDRYAQTMTHAEASQAARKERIATKATTVEGDQIWESAKREMALQMTKATFDMWLRDTYGLGQEDGVYTVVAPNALTRDWLDNRLTTTAQRTLVGILGEQVEVTFEVEG